MLPISEMEQILLLVKPIGMIFSREPRGMRPGLFLNGIDFETMKRDDAFVPNIANLQF